MAVGECEINWESWKNALRAYFSKTFYPTTGLTANIASVSEYSRGYGKTPGRENLNTRTLTHKYMHTNKNIKPGTLPSPYRHFDLSCN